MREWLEVCGSTVVATIEPVERTTSAQIVAPDMRSEIVLILAGLFLQKREEVHG
jgi:UDP-N-acetylglucosamine enolpyruvyl transferase